MSEQASEGGDTASRIRYLEKEVATLCARLRAKRDRIVLRRQITYCTMVVLMAVCTHILVKQQRLDRLFNSAQKLLRPEEAAPTVSPLVELFSLLRSISDA